jgi:hypothetical protein
LPLGEKEAFHRDAPDRRQIDDIRVLDAVTKAPACGNQRVGEAKRSD